MRPFGYLLALYALVGIVQALSGPYEEVYVSSETGNDDSGDGSIENPYESVSRAAVTPDGSPLSDRQILLMGGVYVGDRNQLIKNISGSVSIQRYNGSCTWRGGSLVVADIHQDSSLTLVGLKLELSQEDAILVKADAVWRSSVPDFGHGLALQGCALGMAGGVRGTLVEGWWLDAAFRDCSVAGARAGDAPDSCGSSICLADSLTTVENCTFVGGVGASGGAFKSVRTISGHVEAVANTTVRGSVFHGNSAANGGSVFVFGSGGVHLLIDACRFTAGAAGDGGASVGRGGAVYFKALDPGLGAVGTASTLVIEASSFVDCITTGPPAYSDRGIGGAVYSTAADTIVRNTNASGCQASFGGGLFVQPYAEMVGTVYHSYGGFYFNNTAVYYGGALFYGRLVDVHVEGGQFVDNTAMLGGAIHASQDYRCDKAAVVDCAFMGNIAIWDGGALVLVAETQLVTKSHFYNNHALNENGGAMMVWRTTIVHITESAFELQHASDYGGAVHVLGVAHPSIRDCTFRNCFAKNGGGAVCSETIEVVGCSFSNCSTSGFGGSLLSTSAAEVVDSSFRDSSARSSGGAVYAYEITRAQNTTFANCSAAHRGGALFYMNGWVVDCAFESCRATEGGGAAQEGSIGEVVGCHFAGCGAVRGGAAQSTTPRYANTSFDGNTAEEDGGGVYAVDAADFVECVFSANTAGVAGGGLFAARSAEEGGLVRVSGGCFANNSADGWGGGVYVDTPALRPGLEIRSGPWSGQPAVFVGNTAGKGGGGVFYSLSYSDGVVSCAEEAPLIDAPGKATFAANTAPYGADVGSEAAKADFGCDSTVAYSDDRSFVCRFGMKDCRGASLPLVSFANSSSLSVVQEPAAQAEAVVAELWPTSDHAARQRVFHIRMVARGFDPDTYARVAHLVPAASLVASVGLPAVGVFNISVGRCRRGSGLQTRVLAGANISECVACPKGQFDLLGTGRCEPCPPYGAVCEGGSSLAVLPGYWRSSNFSSHVYWCPRQTSCVGGLRAASGPPCARGYTGRICTQCRESYVKRQGRVCSQCPLAEDLDGAKGILTVTAASMLFLGLTVLPAGMFYVSRAEGRSSASVHLRVLVSHVQVLALAFMFRTRAAIYIGKAISWFEDSSIFSNYFLCRAGLDVFQLFVVRTVVPMLMGVPFLVAALGRFVSRSRRKATSPGASPLPVKEQDAEKEDGSAVVRGLFLVFLGVLYVSYPSITAAVASMLSCRPVVDCSSPEECSRGSAGNYLTVDMAQECRGSKHAPYFYAAVVALVLYSVLLPLLFTVYMVQKIRQKQLSSRFCQRNFYVLYSGYKDRFAFWESVILFRKVLLALVVFLVYEPETQLFLATAVIGIAAVLQFFFRPYQSKGLNRSESASLGALLFTYFSSSGYDHLFRDGGAQTTPAFNDTISLASITVNLLALGVIGGLYVQKLYRNREDSWRYAIEVFNTLYSAKDTASHRVRGAVDIARWRRGPADSRARHRSAVPLRQLRLDSPGLAPCGLEE